ncbi:hypothetical protein GX586_09410 [bacterium]|nr:hypothetical protein [bacterium]
MPAAVPTPAPAPAVAQTDAPADTTKLMNAETKTPYARIQDAAARGRISRKDAVLLTARLLFAPATFPPDSEFAPAPGAPARVDECGTSFYKEVHAVYDELDDGERRWLASLSEDLRVIIAQKEFEQTAQ